MAPAAPRMIQQRRPKSHIPTSFIQKEPKVRQESRRMSESSGIATESIWSIAGRLYPGRLYFNSNRVPFSNDSEQHRGSACTYPTARPTYPPCTSDKVIQSEESCFQWSRRATDYAVSRKREQHRRSVHRIWKKGVLSPPGTRDYSYYCNKDTRFVCSRTRGKMDSSGEPRRFIRSACRCTSLIKCLHV